ncbi:MAG: TatD family hydrolase [Patescibacteria group bacterium]
MIIDTHAHVNFQAFDKDRDEVMNRAAENKTAMILVGANYKSSLKAAEMANKYPNTFAAVGLHPTHLTEQVFEEEGGKIFAKAEKFDLSAFEELALNVDVKAIGECGLDYYHLNPNIPFEEQKKLQKQVFSAHLELAHRQNLPLLLHCRSEKEGSSAAYEDMLSVLRSSRARPRGVLHCFSADWETAKQFLSLGFYLGFNGIITYSKSVDLLEVIRRIPKHRILSETDCPYLTPVPFRGKRNEPIYVEYVIEKIAQVREISYESAAKLTLSNAKKLFHLEIASN